MVLFNNHTENTDLAFTTKRAVNFQKTQHIICDAHSSVSQAHFSASKMCILYLEVFMVTYSKERHHKKDNTSNKHVSLACYQTCILTAAMLW